MHLGTFDARTPSGFKVKTISPVTIWSYTLPQGNISISFHMEWTSFFCSISEFTKDSQAKTFITAIIQPLSQEIMTTIYILLFLSRGIYNIYANEQHMNHIRCEYIKLYFFSLNRATILKQVLIQSTARILHSKLIKSKQRSLGTNKKRKPIENGICINLYKLDHLVHSYICHFLYACRISIYKN